jgi:hypothetical protein
LARRILLAAIVGLVVVAYVVVRDADRRDARFTIVSGPPDPVVALELPRKAPVRFDVRPTSVKGPGRVLTQVGTFLQPAKDTVTVTVFGPRGERIARCITPPASYHDNDQLACPVQDVSRVRAFRIALRGGAKLAVIAHDRTAGYLSVDEQTSFLGRASTVLSRIATSLPNGVGSAVALLGLFGSVALTALALLWSLCATPAPRGASEGDGSDSEDSTG